MQSQCTIKFLCCIEGYGYCGYHVLNFLINMLSDPKIFKTTEVVCCEWCTINMMSVCGEPCKNDFVILTSATCKISCEKKPLALLVYIISRGNYVFKLILWRRLLERECRALVNLSSVLTVKSASWSARNFCSIYLLSLGVNNMSKLLLDQLNFSKKKCTKTSSIDSSSNLAKIQLSMRNISMKREREREIKLQYSEVVENNQILENQSIMVSGL